MIIYKAQNKINSKVYIGQTINSLQKRIYGHKRDINDNTKFHRALKKYGIDNFKWEVIKECNCITALNIFEKIFIKKYDSINKGYNLKEGGVNGKHTEETKQKIINSLLNRKVSN